MEHALRTIEGTGKAYMQLSFLLITNEGTGRAYMQLQFFTENE